LLPATSGFDPSITFYNWFRSDTGISSSNWGVKQTGTAYCTGSLTGGSDITTSVTLALNNNLAITGPFPLTATTNGNAPSGIQMVWQYLGDGDLITILNGASVLSTLSITAGVFSQDGNAINTGQPIVFGAWYLVSWFYVGGPYFVVAVPLGDLDGYGTGAIQGTSAANSRAGGNTLSLGNSGTTMAVADLIIYNATQFFDFAEINSDNSPYFNDHYNQVYLLPLTFPASAVSKVNNTSYLPSGIPVFINEQGVFISGSGGVMGAG